MSKDIDLLVYGATGFTGKQAAARAADALAPDKTLAIGGRNADKLEAVARGLDRDVEIVVADAHDEAALSSAVARTRVVASTAGPYLKYGTPLFEACVEHGAGYVDITGEAHWVRGLIKDHHARAREDGTVLVPFCGFDSVPSDLGTFLVGEHLHTRHGQRLKRARTQFRPRGDTAFNGGTVATMLSLRDAPRDVRRAVFNPYALCPDETVPADVMKRDRDLPHPVPAFHGKGWDAPFLMAIINTRVVRRTAALLAGTDDAYAPWLEYQETMRTRGRTPLRAARMTALLGAIPLLLKRRAGRKLIERMAPAPGEGPTEEQMDRGKTRAVTYGEGDGGARASCTLHYDGDPGNRFTVLSLIECARLLAEEPEACGFGVPGEGGVLTPAVAFGHRLADRLREGGVRITVEDLPP